MNSIYIVQSWFEDLESTSWRIVGTFTEKKLAEDIAKKWEDFYEEKKSIFDKPKDWVPSESDLEYDDEYIVGLLRCYDGLHMSFPYLPIEVLENTLKDNKVRPIYKLY